MHKHKGNFGYFSNFIRHGAIFSNVLHFALYTTNMKVACLLVARYALDTEKSKQHLYNFHPPPHRVASHRTLGVYVGAWVKQC